MKKLNFILASFICSTMASSQIASAQTINPFYTPAERKALEPVPVVAEIDPLTCSEDEFAPPVPVIDPEIEALQNLKATNPELVSNLLRANLETTRFIGTIDGSSMYFDTVSEKYFTISKEDITNEK